MMECARTGEHSALTARKTLDLAGPRRPREPAVLTLGLGLVQVLLPGVTASALALSQTHMAMRTC